MAKDPGIGYKHDKPLPVRFKDALLIPHRGRRGRTDTRTEARRKVLSIMPDPVANFLDSLRASRLLEPEQWDSLSEAGTLEPRDPDLLAEDLVQKGWLTPYQVERLRRGDLQHLALGTYHLLELLGEGGMGQVFKARHVKMRRIVALKVIHKDLLASPEAIRRFDREIRGRAAPAPEYRDRP